MAKSVPAKLMVVPIGKQVVYHFRSHAARRKAASLGVSGAVAVAHKLATPVEITVATHHHVPLTEVRALRRHQKAMQAEALAAVKAAA